jgi:hypothetical protein
VQLAIRENALHKDCSVVIRFYFLLQVLDYTAELCVCDNRQIRELGKVFLYFFVKVFKIYFY